MTVNDTYRRAPSRTASVRLILAAAAACVFNAGPERPIVQAVGNPIVIENQQNGDINWDVSGSGDPSIQGFATDISVNTGETVNFKIKTDSNSYTIDIYRLGYYGGAGARKVATLGSFTQPQNQNVPCVTDAATGLFDCGRWLVSASWPSTGAVSGIYIAKLTRTDTGGSSHVIFIVRDDARQADIVVQTSDTTWQAYNRYGGGNLYCGGPFSNSGTAYACPNRAAKVSYNRPFETRAHDPQNWVFNAEYPMLRWLEANGYDVKYQSGVDTDRLGAALVGLRKPKAFLSVGHDEYWSGNQRTMVENARDAGVHLAFFSGNEMFWKTRFEPSIDGSATPYRTLVTYKETLAGGKIDPAVDAAGQPIWTGSWRDPRFSPPADGGRPENALTGTAWTVNSGTTAITVPASMARLRLWQNTRVAALTSGMATLAAGTLGFEWDEDVDNGARPVGLVHLSSTTLDGAEKLLDYGATVGLGTATHALTLYRHPSGALVFGAGTVQWPWGLDAIHDRAGSIPDQAMQQATVNLLADMGVQPGSLQVGADPNRPLLATSASTDQFAPASVIASPVSGGQVESHKRLTITGTATDSGGAVAGVEVSTDGGATWHLARGGAAWSYEWAPGTIGSATIRSRAIDDSGNIEAAGTGITVSIVAGRCPCSSNSLWDSSAVPTLLNSPDTNPVEIGVKFTSEVPGFITAVRFYKGPANIGPHQGSLWTIDGRRLATAVFAAETATGWQQVSFESPVPIDANTTYVASYHSNVGAYSIDTGYFTNLGVDSPPLHAAPSVTNGGNGVFSYGASTFPTRGFNASNYWVDVVFAETVADATSLEISAITVVVIDDSTATVTWKTNNDATSRIDYSVDPSLSSFTLGATHTQSDGAFVTEHTMRLAGLTPTATYHVAITSMDRAGTVQMATAPDFVLPGPTLHDTAAADFFAGTQDAICDPSGACAPATYVSQTGDGELILAPILGSEFTGPTLPTGWIKLPWNSEGYAIVDDGVLVVDGARVASCVTDAATGACIPGETAGATPSAIFTSPRTLDFAAKFSAEHFQHVGFGQTFAAPSEPWAMFSTRGGNGQLYARTNTGTGSVDTPLGFALLGRFHRFRIDWQPASVDYYVDGVLVDHQPLVINGPMRPIAGSDLDISDGRVFVDWMRMTPYARSGSFLSRVFDAKTPVNWASISWTSVTPAGTSLDIYVRTGNTPTPDDTWSSFALRRAPGAFSAQAQYVQYRVDMATVDGTRTPELDDIIISTDHVPVAVDDSAVIATDTSYIFPASGDGSLSANDTDVDGDILRVTAVTSPAHGVTTVNSTGSVKYTPAPGFTGVDRFTYTVSDGLLSATGTVAISVGVSPTANPDAVTVLEDSGGNAIDVLANDAGAAIAVTAVTQGVHGAVTFTPMGVSYTPLANYTGADSFTYTIANSAGVASGSVTIVVAGVNDGPSFTEGPNQAAFMNAGTQTVTGWATALNAGPPDESAQTLSFIVSNTNNALFSTQPSVAADGTLTYTPAADAVGSAVVSVAIRDSGGTANGGVDTSASQTFTIAVAQATTIASKFNGTAIAAGDFVWFSSILKVQGLGSSPVTIGFTGSISFIVNGTPYSVPVPFAVINFSPTVTAATTTLCDGQWVTTVPSSGLAGNVFLDGVAFQAPLPDGLPGGIQNITWQGMFFGLTPGLNVQWKWGAAVYRNATFGADYNALGVKPVDDGKASIYKNADHAGTPENFKTYLAAGATGGGGANFTGGYSGTAASTPLLANIMAACGGD